MKFKTDSEARFRGDPAVRSWMCCKKNRYSFVLSHCMTEKGTVANMILNTISKDKNQARNEIIFTHLNIQNEFFYQSDIVKKKAGWQWQ